MPRQYIRDAIQRTGRMTERERYRTRAYLYFLTGDYQKCVDEYGALLDRYSADTGAYTNIAVCLVHLAQLAQGYRSWPGRPWPFCPNAPFITPIWLWTWPTAAISRAPPKRPPRR